MDGSLVAPDWPPLTLDELRPLFAQFPALGEPVRILTVSPRPFSAAGVVETSAGRVFVKRQSLEVRDREGLCEEHRFMTYLREHGAPVPRVMVSEAGESAIERGAWIYEIHETPAGVDLYEEAISWTPFQSAAHAYSAGRLLAQLHLAAQGFAAPLRKPQPLVASFTIFAAVDPAAELASYLAVRPALANHQAVRDCAARALEILAPFHAWLLPLLPTLAPLWTHNDLHASNLFWSDAGSEARATTAIDFGLADRTNAVHDIAHAIERNIVEWLVLVNDPAHPDDVPVHLDHLEALLDGYESLRPLSAEEAEALLPMAALCHVEFALTEADYFLGALHSEEKAKLAYDDYLVGHALWQHSVAGRGLLAALSRRARAHVQFKGSKE
jgi:Ser/Thr protein kinase RdoA (MazF antagonist)